MSLSGAVALPLKNLYSCSAMGNVSELERLMTSVELTQEEIDNAFRECIRNFKNQNENYINCVKLFLNKTENINYRNKNYDNTTIPMFCFEVGQETPTELVIDNFISEIDLNITDNKGENCLFKLLKNKTFPVDTKNDYFTQLISDNLDLNYVNNNGETLLSLIQKDNNTTLLEQIKLIEKKNRFDIDELIDFLNKEDYGSLLEKIKKFKENENFNFGFEFNILLTEMKMILKKVSSIQEGKSENGEENQTIFSTTGEGHFLDEYQCNIIKLIQRLPEDRMDVVMMVNKLIMLYQLDQFDEFEKLKNRFRDIGINDRFLFFYARTMSFLMMMERNKIDEAKKELISLEKNVFSKPVDDRMKKESYAYFFRKNEMPLLSNEREISLYLKLMELYALIQEKSETNEGSFKENRIKRANDEINSLKITKANSSYSLYIFYIFTHISLLYYKMHFTQNAINQKLEELLQSMEQRDEVSQVFYYNSYGILNLKNGNYSLSSYYFLKCIQIIRKKTPLQLIKKSHYYPRVAYNLALSYFYMKKKKECYKILSSLAQSKRNSFILNNKYLYYRLGLVELEIYLQTLDGGNSKGGDVYEKYENSYFLLKSSSLKKPEFPDSIVINFKKVLTYIDRGDKIYINTCFNLIFSLIISNQYLEAIFFLNEVKPSNQNEENIVNTYYLECYLGLNRIEEAIDYSKKIALSTDISSSFFERVSKKIIFEKYKLSFYVNMIKLCIKANKKEEIEKYLFCILDSVNLNISITEKGVDSNEELPPFVINVFVYYYLMINKIDLAINILKTRKIKHIMLTSKT